MPSEGQRPSTEYYLTTTSDDVGTPTPAVNRLPVPAAGRVTRVSAVRHAALSAACDVVIAGPGGTIGTLTMPTSGSAGDIDVLEINVRTAAAYLQNGEQITLTPDAVPAAGLVDFIVSIQR